jgi:hypothetical protein
MTQVATLNYPDAMRLASILTKYIDPSNVEESPREFISSILDKITPVDYLHCIRMIFPNEAIGELSGDTLLEIFYAGLEKNKIISLVKNYREMGFT